MSENKKEKPAPKQDAKADKKTSETVHLSAKDLRKSPGRQLSHGSYQAHYRSLTRRRGVHSADRLGLSESTGPRASRPPPKTRPDRGRLRGRSGRFSFRGRGLPFLMSLGFEGSRSPRRGPAFCLSTRSPEKLLNSNVAATMSFSSLNLGGKLAMSDSETPPSGPPMDMSGVALEQLDTLVRVTTIQAWISLGTLFAVCAGAVLFAFLYRVPKKIVGEGILLIKRDRLSQVQGAGHRPARTSRCHPGPVH